MDEYELNLDFDFDFESSNQKAELQLSLDFDGETDNESEQQEYAQLFPDMPIENKFVDNLKGFKQREMDQRRRVAAQTDGDYYSVIVFQSRDQRNKFIEAYGGDEIVIDNDGHYLNGLKLCEKLGIQQERIELPEKKFAKAFTNNII